MATEEMMTGEDDDRCRIVFDQVILTVIRIVEGAVVVSGVTLTLQMNQW
jgi:hypothetical protein